mgnify:CR=1 FL=1
MIYGVNTYSDMSDSSVRIALNGFGRIGRNVVRALPRYPDVELVAINDVMEPAQMAYLAEYDTVMGRDDSVTLADGRLQTEAVDAALLQVRDPTTLPWADLDVDVVLECTGIFRTHEDAAMHLEAGAGKVIISAPPRGETPVTQLVYGVNHDTYAGEDIVSNASCTTNSVTPIAQVLDATFGIDHGMLTTVHAYTGSQQLLDGPMAKPRRGRAAAENILPTTTGAAEAATVILPQLAGKLDGMAIRVPVPNGSLTELVVTLDAAPTVEAVNDAFRAAAAAGPLAGVLGVTDDPLVSSDIQGMPYSSIVDLASTNRVGAGAMYKVLTWYDNEFGFSNRMLDMARFITA